jgi:hypothetical protein
LETKKYNRTTLPKDSPFKAIGMVHKENDDFPTYYYRVANGRLHGLCAEEHDVRHLLMLAPLQWYEQAFPGNNGPNWVLVVDSLYGACEAGLVSARPI